MTVGHDKFEASFSYIMSFELTWGTKRGSDSNKGRKEETKKKGRKFERERKRRREEGRKEQTNE